MKMIVPFFILILTSLTADGSDIKLDLKMLVEKVGGDVKRLEKLFPNSEIRKIKIAAHDPDTFLDYNEISTDGVKLYFKTDKLGKVTEILTYDDSVTYGGEKILGRSFCSVVTSKDIDFEYSGFNVLVYLDKLTIEFTTNHIDFVKMAIEGVPAWNDEGWCYETAIKMFVNGNANQ